MILRGVCTMRRSEVEWMFGGGAGVLKPWAWGRFLEHLDPSERAQPLLGYYRRLLSLEAPIRDAAVSVGQGVALHLQPPTLDRVTHAPCTARGTCMRMMCACTRMHGSQWHGAMYVGACSRP